MSANGVVHSGVPGHDTLNSDDPSRLQAKLDLVTFLTSHIASEFQEGDDSVTLESLEALLEVSKIVTAHSGLLIEALPEVPGIQIDWAHKRIRAVRKPQRNTIIIRNIKAGENDVRGIFDVNGAPGKATKVRADIGDTWFVSFETEQVAVDTLIWIRTQQFQGKSISARMKSETQQKGFYTDIPPFSNGQRNHFPRHFNPHAPMSGNGYSTQTIQYSKDLILDIIKTVKVSKPSMAECEVVTNEPNLKLEIQPDEPPRHLTERAKDGHPHADAPEYIPQNLKPLPVMFPEFRTKRTRPNSQERAGEDLTFNVDVQAIAAGQDHRTTLMIKNIPNKYSQRMLLQSVEETNKGSFDFIYLPIDFRNWCNVGYAFINFLTTKDVALFYEAFHGQKWKHFKSEKICQITYARIQGKDALIDHFARSRLLSEDKRCRPMILDQGKLVPLTRRFWGDNTGPDEM